MDKCFCCEGQRGSAITKALDDQFVSRNNPPLCSDCSDDLMKLQEPLLDPDQEEVIGYAKRLGSDSRVLTYFGVKGGETVQQAIGHRLLSLALVRSHYTVSYVLCELDCENWTLEPILKLLRVPFEELVSV